MIPLMVVEANVRIAVGLGCEMVDGDSVLDSAPPVGKGTLSVCPEILAIVVAGDNGVSVGFAGSVVWVPLDDGADSVEGGVGSWPSRVPVAESCCVTCVGPTEGKPERFVEVGSDPVSVAV